MSQATTNVVKEKASPKLMFGYGLGEVGCQMSWYMINSYLNIFYTDVVGLTGAAISAIVLIARIWDAINDPMMGQIAERTNTRWGKFRPYLPGPARTGRLQRTDLHSVPGTGLCQNRSLRHHLYRCRYGLHSLLDCLPGPAERYRG